MVSPRLAAVIAMLVVLPLKAQTIEEFNLPAGSGPAFITAGPDGAMWFTLNTSRAIGRIAADGSVTTFPVPAQPGRITTGPDNNLWFGAGDQIGRLSPAGALTMFNATGRGGDIVSGITSGGDGHLWYGVTTTFNNSTGMIRRMNVDGQVAGEFILDSSTPNVPARPAGITAASDGSIWFTDQRHDARGRIGRIRDGVVTMFDLRVPSAPFGIIPAAEGGVWFTDFANGLGRMNDAGISSFAGLAPPGYPFGIARASDGAIWTTLNAVSSIARFEPTTNAVAITQTPTENSRPGGIAFGPDGFMWFTEAAGNKIGRVQSVEFPDEADLAVTMTGTSTTEEKIMYIFRHEVTIRNRGAQEARDVEVILKLPLDNDPEYILSAGTCTEGARRARCTLGTMPPGATRRIEFLQTGSSFTPTNVRAEAFTTSRESYLDNNFASIYIHLVDCDGLTNCPIVSILAIAICESRLGQNNSGSPARHETSRPSLASRGFRLLGKIIPFENLPFELDVFSRLRDQVFARTSAGRRYTEMYYTHGLEISRIYFLNPEVRLHATATIQLWQESIRALVEGTGAMVTISSEQIAALQKVLDDLEQHGSPQLRATIGAEEAKLGLASLTGRTMTEALARQTQTAPSTITLPAAASLRGVPPTFFHSDVRVFNPSTAPVEVTARYRCLSGSCGNSERSVTLAPREMRTFEDMPGRFFGAAESAGAVEFEGAVLVDSRLYTPDAGAPTTGMYVPSLTAGEAYAEAVLTSLSYSTNGSRGFRTNIGVYNPNDIALDVRFLLHDRMGVLLGEVIRPVPARAPLQINNTFAAAGVSVDLDGAYAVVTADGVHELFAYASVIDNQSQDLMFVYGRNRRRGSFTEATLPATASLHGVPPTFFHSDVTILNPSSESAVTVTAEYRCSTPPCGSGTSTFDLAPGEARRFEDAVVSLFAAPETAGAIELHGEVLVDSRLYTPSLPAPSTGMYVPGLDQGQAYAESVLLSLSHSTDNRRGFRTNAGVYNPNLIPLEVTFTIFDGSGTRLGEVSRAVPARTPLQINNTFAAAGITVDVPNAYCVVRADGARKLFAYASVIDNQSQDLIFVRGIDGSGAFGGASQEKLAHRSMSH